jgi:hypothetical protein
MAMFGSASAQGRLNTTFNRFQRMSPLFLFVGHAMESKLKLR